MENENQNINPFLEAIPDREMKHEEENLKSDEAKKSVSKAAEPAAEKTATEESVTAEPVTEESITKESITKESTTEESTTEEAAVAEPVTSVPEQKTIMDNYSYNTGTKTTGYQSDYRKEVLESEMSLGDWVITILAMFLPCCVGIVIYFVWAFGEQVNPNRKKFCRAWLIVNGVILVLGVLSWLVIFLCISTSI